VSEPTADLLDRLGAAFPGSAAARRDREFISLLDRGDTAPAVVGLYRAALDDPVERARVTDLYRRFDELASTAPDDPRVADLARDLAAALPPELAAAVPAGPGVDGHPLGAAILRDLPPAQAAAIREAHRLLSGESVPGGMPTDRDRPGSVS
jgi:hypothetical protein